MAEASLDIVLRERGAKQLENSIRGVLDSVADTQKGVDNFAKKGGLAALSVGSQQIDLARARANQLGQELLNAEVEASKLYAQLSTAPPNEIPKITRQLADLETQSASARLELSRLPAELNRQVLDAVDNLGYLEQSLSQIGGSIAGLGASPLGRIAGIGGGIVSGAGPLAPIGQGFQMGADIFGLAEALPRLSGAINETRDRALGYIVTAGQQAIATQTVAGAAATTVAPLGAMAQGLTAIAIQAAPFVAATAAIAGGAFLLNKEFSRGKKEINTYISAEEKRLDTLRFVANAVETMSKEQVRAEVERLEFEIEANKKIQAGLVETYGKTIDNVSQLEEGANLFGTAIGKITGLDITGLNKLSSELTTYNDAIVEAEIKLDAYNNEILKEIEARERLTELQQSGVASGERYIEYLQERANREVQFNEQLQNMSAEEAQTRIGELQLRKKLDEQNRAELERALEENNKVISDGIAAGLPEETFANLIEENRILYKEISRLDEAINSTGEEIGFLESQVLPLATAREEEEKAIELLKKSEEQLSETRRQTVEELNSVRQQIADLEKDFMNKELERAFQENLKRERDAEDAAYKRRVEQAKSNELFRKQQEQSQKAIAEIRNKEADINRKFMESQLKASQDFYKKESRIIEDEQTERLRKLRDFSDQLLEAYENNDVRAFARTLKAQNRFLEDDTQDTDTEARRRLEDFQSQQDEARANRLRELDELRVHAEQRRQQEVEARNQQESEVDRIQREWDRIRQQRTVDDENRRLQLERDAHQKRLAVLKQQEEQLTSQVATINAKLASSIFGNILNRMAGGAASGAAPTMYPAPIGPMLPPSRNTNVNMPIRQLNLGSVVTQNELNQQLSNVKQTIRKFFD